MPAAHVLEAGANRCGEQAGQSLRRKARADTAVRNAECTEPDAVRIPEQSDHRFRRKVITHSGGNRSPIPAQTDQ